MSRHRHDADITELKYYFNSVIDWILAVFGKAEKEMRGLEQGALYERYHKNSYNPDEVAGRVKELYADGYLTNKKGIFEYILGGRTDTKLLHVRFFDESVKKSVYAKQTSSAKKEGVSNYPLCALGSDSNKARIWKEAEMDADHVSAWSKGGDSSAANCQMLCKTHNQAKGNQ